MLSPGASEVCSSKVTKNLSRRGGKKADLGTWWSVDVSNFILAAQTFPTLPPRGCEVTFTSLPTCSA